MIMIIRRARLQKPTGQILFSNYCKQDIPMTFHFVILLIFMFYIFSSLSFANFQCMEWN
jgi:hypothetical protein